MLPLSAAWGLCPHHQTKLPNVRSESLLPAEAEDVESNQTQPRTQHSQPNQLQLLFLIQTALLKANPRKSHIRTALLRVNLRKSYHPQTVLLRANPRTSSETIFGLLTTYFLADTMKRRHRSQHQLQTSTNLIQRSFLHNQAPTPTANQHQLIPAAIPAQPSYSFCRI